jgi:hypothetical protein
MLTVQCVVMGDAPKTALRSTRLRWTLARAKTFQLMVCLLNLVGLGAQQWHSGRYQHA